MIAQPHPRRLGGLRVLVAGAAVLGVLWVFGARGTTVFLRGGEKVIGTILSEDAERVHFESRTLGRVVLERDRIERIERDAVVEKAVDPPPPPSAVTLEPPVPFVPWLASPSDAGYDWIQIRTGEWLKGRVRSLQEETLEFDSEELDLLTFDWDKIRTLYAPHPSSVRFEGDKPVDGFVTATTNEVRVVSGDSTNVRPRADLIALTPTGDREVDRWTG
ncbi:MAG: hypothetical protein JNL97_14090, partial [Verrucomicrobiales bacterium]|nr:hypothetical protein [Verrucomicrobiales bacterium]